MVIEYAFPVSDNPANVDISPSEIVAVTIPDVAAANVLAWLVVAVPLVIFMASLPRFEIPDDA